jgi:hypothetical protein
MSAKVYTIHSHFGFIRDAEYQPPKETELSVHFRDAMILFRARVERLASLSHTTTKDEAESMKVMLEALIEAKRRLHS